MNKRLELNKETLRELTDDDLVGVDGGWKVTTTCPGATQSPMCPSGATWFTSCESYNATCG